MGEKVICVKRIFRSDVHGLTLDKEYEIIKEDKYSYLIVDDNNKTFPYDKNNFKRLCVRADKPIQQVAKLMREEVLSVEPRYAEYLVPQCQAMMYCPEHKGCGAYPSKEELKKLIRGE